MWKLMKNMTAIYKRDEREVEVVIVRKDKHISHVRFYGSTKLYKISNEYLTFTPNDKDAQD